jgi:hypothetical protein
MSAADAQATPALALALRTAEQLVVAQRRAAGRCNSHNSNRLQIDSMSTMCIRQLGCSDAVEVVAALQRTFLKLSDVKS